MFISESDLFMPVCFSTLNDFYEFIVQRTKRAGKRSLTRLRKEKGHLLIRCPIIGDILDVTGTEWELNWLDNELRRNDWYALTDAERKSFFDKSL